jgi:hypothetical protein
MKKADAEAMIIRLWHVWPERNAPPGPGKGLLFYGWLSSEHPQVLSFRTPVTDKWQIVSGLLGRHGLT